MNKGTLRTNVATASRVGLSMGQIGIADPRYEVGALLSRLESDKINMPGQRAGKSCEHPLPFSRDDCNPQKYWCLSTLTWGTELWKPWWAQAWEAV